MRYRFWGLLDSCLAAVEEQEIETSILDDVSLRPGPNADDQADVDRYISAKVRALYDVYSYRHAAAILANSFPDELKEIEEALLAFSITKRDIGTPGRICRRSFLAPYVPLDGLSRGFKGICW